MKRGVLSRARRGISGSVVAAVLVGAVVLLFLGFALGRGQSEESINVTIDADELANTLVEELDSRRSDGIDSQVITEAVKRGVQTALNEQGALVGFGSRSSDSHGAHFPALDEADDIASMPPPFRFEPEVLDFGRVEPGDEMSGTVLIRNISDEPLLIEGMRADCKCTTLEDLTGELIMPNDVIELNAVVEGRSSAGPMRSAVRFVFRDYGTATLEIYGEITRAVQADPQWLAASEQASGEYTLTALDDRPFEVLAVNGERPIFADGFNPAEDAPRTSYRLSWKLDQYDSSSCLNAEGEWMPRWWVVETNHPKAPIVDLQIRHMPCTLRSHPQNNRNWILSETRVIIDEIVAGESTEFEVFLKPYHTEYVQETLRDVRSEAPEQFDVQLISTEQFGEKVRCLVRVTTSPHHRGLIYGVAQFYGVQMGQSEGLIVIGRAVAEGSERSVSTGR